MFLSSSGALFYATCSRSAGDVLGGALIDLYRFFGDAGAELVGGIDVDGFEFKRSKAVVDGRCVGLALDQHLQQLRTDARIETWLDEVLPLLLEVCEEPAAATA